MSASPAEPSMPNLAEVAASVGPDMKPVVAQEPPKPAEPPKADPPKPDDSKPWDDPDAAKAEILRLRKENGAERTNAKAQAAEDAKKEFAQTIGKALGLVEDEVVDPAKLTESLTTAQSEAKQARVELAVFRNAAAANGDPAALLDSTSFLKSLDGIDPNDSAALTAAIQSAVEANPRLGAATDPRTPAPNPAQGSSGGGAPSLDAQIAAAQKAGDTRLAIHLQNQKLAPQTRT